MNTRLGKIEKLLALPTAALLLYCNFLVFLYVPNEKVMGAVQRIFYFHVGSAIACYVAFALVLIGSLTYLAKRSFWFDALAEAGGEVGFVFCTLVLISGMIWGHAAWGTWFNWEPRLVTFLLLWLLFLGYNLLRLFGDRNRVAAHAAVLGIIGAITVPVMVFSIKLLPHISQLHPEVVGKPGGLAPGMGYALAVTVLTVVLLQFWLVIHRFRIALLEGTINE